MSDSPRSEPSTEPRGLRLPYGPPPGAAHPAGHFDRLRSQLITTAVVAGCVIVLLAAAGFAAIAAKWYPTTDVAYGVAGGTVLVGVVAALRVFVLFRALEQVPPLPPLPPPPMPAPPVEPRQVVVEPRPPVPAMASAPAFTEGIEQWGDVFGKLSRRLQSLVNRLIRSIDRMEHELEDPDLLDMLWSIDHLATLVRRQAENIAVLGGETLERRSDTPVDVNAVLRSSVAEIQRYRQVVTIPIRDARIHGHVVAEIIHLLSELLDNATTFTPDDAPKVAFRAQYVTAGLAIQVQDRGIGMDPDDLRRINHLLERDTQLDVGELFKDGRIGLAVVKELARRHHIGVEMQPNIYGGIDASIVVPHHLLDRPANGTRDRRATQVREPARESVVRERTSSQPVPARAAAPTAPPRPTPQPTAQPTSQPTPRPATQPATASAAQPTPRPTPQPAAQSAAAPTAQPTPQPAAQPASQPAAQPTAQSAAAQATQPASQPTAQPAASPASQPAPQSASQRTPQPVAQQAPKAAAQPPRVPAVPPKPSPQPTSQPQPQPQTQQPQRKPTPHPVGQAAARPAPPDSPPAPTAEPEPEEKISLPVRQRGTALAAVQAGLAPPGTAESAAGLRRTTESAGSVSGTSEHTSGHGGAGHTAGNGDAEPAPGKLEIREPPPSQERPPLPNRREQQSYLRPELRQAPVLTRPIPGHSPNLLADLQLGRAAGEEEAPKLTNPDQQPPRANEQDTEGDKGTWPTI